MAVGTQLHTFMKILVFWRTSAVRGQGWVFMVPKNRIIFYMVFLDTAQNTSAKVFSKKVKEIPCITLESNYLVKKKKIQIIDFNAIYNYLHSSLNSCCRIHTCQTGRLNTTVWHYPDHNVHIDNLHTMVTMGTSQCIFLTSRFMISK